jgi:hypothetical protein
MAFAVARLTIDLDLRLRLRGGRQRDIRRLIGDFVARDGGGKGCRRLRVGSLRAGEGEGGGNRRSERKREMDFPDLGMADPCGTGAGRIKHAFRKFDAPWHQIFL